MTAQDLPGVRAVAAAVHPAYPEDDAVFAERLRLYRAGCRVLEGAGRILGYGIGHPWLDGAPPNLNCLLGRLPDHPTAFYIHDIALLPESRGAGAGAAIVEYFVALARAEGFSTIVLVAVAGSEGFWRRQGFDATSDAAIQAGLASYGAAARLMRRATG
jgi:GNAT superfamily N-acetyltransferase